MLVSVLGGDGGVLGTMLVPGGGRFLMSAVPLYALCSLASVVLMGGVGRDMRRDMGHGAVQNAREPGEEGGDECWAPHPRKALCGGISKVY